MEGKAGAEAKLIDTLSASGLSGLFDYPIVLVNGLDSSLGSTARQGLETATNSASNKIKIIIMGGTAAVSPGIETELNAYASDIDRIAGSDGYATNLAAYDYGMKEASWNKGEILVATGASCHDALGSGSYSAANKAYILLANPSVDNALMAEKAANHRKATVLGGIAAVKEDTFEQLKAKGLRPTRVCGDDAYKTNIEFVKYAIGQGMSLEGAGFSTGAAYYDSLGSTHLLAKANSVMFLVGQSESLNTPVYAKIKSDTSLRTGKVFGGCAAVTETTKAGIIGSQAWQYVDAPVCSEDHPECITRQEARYVKVKKPFTTTAARYMYNNECGGQSDECDRTFYLTPREYNEPDKYMAWKQSISKHWPSGELITKAEAKEYYVQDYKSRWSKYSYLETWDDLVDLYIEKGWADDVAESYEEQPLKSQYTKRDFISGWMTFKAKDELAMYDHQDKAWADYSKQLAVAREAGKLTKKESCDVSWSNKDSADADSIRAAQEKAGIYVPVYGVDYHPYNYGFWGFKFATYTIYCDSYVATCCSCGGVRF